MQMSKQRLARTHTPFFYLSLNHRELRRVRGPSDWRILCVVCISKTKTKGFGPVFRHKGNHHAPECLVFVSVIFNHPPFVCFCLCETSRSSLRKSATKHAVRFGNAKRRRTKPLAGLPSDRSSAASLSVTKMVVRPCNKSVNCNCK